MPISIDGKEFEDFASAVAYVKKTKPDIEDPEAYVASIEKKLKEQQSTTVQTYIFSKDKFTADQARKWLKDHDKKVPAVDDTENSLRFRQIDPERFDQDSFRTIDIDSGIKAVIGKLQESTGPIRLLETLQGIREGAFSWYPHPLEKLIEVSKKTNGKFILVEGIHPMITDPFNRGHGATEYTPEQLVRSTYTAIGKKMNLVHEMRLNPQYRHIIADGEFNDTTKTAEYVIYEEDPEILRLIREGYITHVSMEGESRRAPIKCDSCDSPSGCICRIVPEGIIFGNEFGEAMAYVVTKPSATYYGKKIPEGPPGDSNTSVKIAEMNHGMGNPITIKELAEKITNHKLKESLLSETAIKTVLKENMDAFNQALSQGDAIQALQILASEVYKTQETDTSSDMEKKMTDKITEAIKPISEKIEETTKNLKEVSSLKESMGNLSTQVQEMNKVIEGLKNVKPTIIREMNQETDWSKVNPKELERKLIMLTSS